MMRHLTWPLVLIVAAALVPCRIPAQGHQHGGASSAPATAPEAPARAAAPVEYGPGGGVIVKSGDQRFEILFFEDALQVRLLDAKGRMSSIEGATASVTVENMPGVARDLTLEAKKVPPGGEGGGAEVTVLEQKAAFADARDGQGSLTFRVEGLPARRGELRFSTAFHLARVVRWRCPKDPAKLLERAADCPMGAEKAQKVFVIWTCPMHPAVRKRDPATACPQCEMNLTPRVEDAKGVAQKMPESGGHDHGGCCGSGKSG